MRRVQLRFVMVDKSVLYQGYDNLAFDCDVNLQNQCRSTQHVFQQLNNDNDNLDDNGARLKRSLSSASQLRLQRSSSLFGGSLPSPGQDLLIHPPHSPRLCAHCADDSSCSTFSDYAFTFPIRSQSELSLTLFLNNGGASAANAGCRAGGCGGSARDGGVRTYGQQKPRSLMYLDEDDYLARPPPSRPVSMGYVNFCQELSNNVIGFKKQRFVRHRKAASLEFLNIREVVETKVNDVSYQDEKENVGVAVVVEENQSVEDVAL